MKTPVVCDEEIDIRAGGACELNGIGCTQGSVQANLGVLPCGFGVEWEQQCGLADSIFILGAQQSVSMLQWLYENFSQCKS